MHFSRSTLRVFSCTLVLAQLLLLVPASHAVEVITSKDFDSFLESCNTEEMVQLAFSLNLITKKEADDKSCWDSLKITPKRIKEGVAYLSYHLLNLGQDGSAIDYHDIVKWVAESLSIDTKDMGTKNLEEEIVKRYMAQLWDSLNSTQRASLLEELEKKGGVEIPNKSKLVAESGIVAIGTLIALKTAVGGFVFFQYAMSFFYIVTGLLGVTISWGTIAPVVALLTGPWGIALVVVGSVLTFGAASPNDVIKFVVTTYFIRCQKQGR